MHADELPQYAVKRASSVAPVRYERNAPDFYRLARMKDGTLVLQGAFYWQQGWTSTGHEWRDVPTVDIAP